MIRLDDVYKCGELAINDLFMLLQERTPEQSISHRRIPSYSEHKAFVESRPYEAWYLIVDEQSAATVGATYLSKQREIGIFIFRRHMGNGYGAAAVTSLMRLHPGVFYANVNPSNTVSIDMFRALGFGLLQVTFIKQ